MDQLHITEYQTTATPPLPDNTPYTQFFIALTLEEYQLLSQQQATPLSQLEYTRPIDCIPGDLRMPHYNSTLLSVSLPEAANVHYYHTTSLHTRTGNNTNYVILQLQIGQRLLLRYLSSGQLLHFTRDYISYMMSVQQNYYLPTTQHPQTIYKVNYDMTTFTDNYSLRNNSHATTSTGTTPLPLQPRPTPRLSTQGHYYHPLQEHPVLRFYTTHHDQPHPTPQGTTTSFP